MHSAVAPTMLSFATFTGNWGVKIPSEAFFDIFVTVRGILMRFDAIKVESYITEEDRLTESACHFRI
jgi:hypothetical protein